MLCQTGCQKTELSQEKQCEVSYQTATNHFMEGRHDQALLEVEKAIAGCPKIWKYWYLKASAEFGLQNYLSAEDSLKQAINLKGDCAICYDLLGQVSTNQKRYTEAYGYYQKALSIRDYRTPVVTIYNIGILYELQGRYSQALEQFNEACRIDPSYDRAFLHKGDTLMLLNRAGEAVFAYRQATVINKTYCDAWIGLVKAYRRTGEFKKATEAVKQACQNLQENSQCCKTLQLLLR